MTDHEKWVTWKENKAVALRGRKRSAETRARISAAHARKRATRQADVTRTPTPVKTEKVYTEYPPDLWSCLCGCGGSANPGNKYIHKHQRRRGGDVAAAKRARTLARAEYGGNHALDNDWEPQPATVIVRCLHCDLHHEVPDYDAAAIYRNHECSKEIAA